MRLFSRLALILVLVLTVAVVGAQDQPTPTPHLDTFEIVPEPVTVEQFRLTSVVPQGWTPLGNGLYARATSQTEGDVTLLAIQSAPLQQDALLAALLPQLQLREAPEPVSTMATDLSEWDLYEVTVEAQGLTIAVDLALTNTGGVTYIVLAQYLPEDRETLYEPVFLAAVESMAPMGAQPEEEVPYHVEGVAFNNGDITLVGTLTRPDVAGQHPAVVLMTGSGPQTRDEEVVPGFPLFKIIADALTREGIAVLRFDDRGVGESGGDYAAATIDDFASDALAAVNYLKTRPDIRVNEVGILGHSEGGLYASKLGANPESGVAFIIIMAGPGTNGKDVLLEQNRQILEAGGATQEQIDGQLTFLEGLFPLVEANDWATVETYTYDSIMAQYELLTPEEQAEVGDAEEYARTSTDQFLANYNTGWFRSFLNYDPAADLAAIQVPVLALFGGKDVQVDEEQNIPLMEAAFAQGSNEDVEIVNFPNANHLFQEAETGNIDEYETLPFEFTPDFLPTIVEWLKARVTITEAPATE